MTEADPKEVTSLTYDQVNDNADELIELRGEGRYFGVTDPNSGDIINAQQLLGPLCANCHKRGHIRAKCKTVVCHKCGVVGEHYEAQCPTTLICAKCGLKGHMAAACKNKQRKRQYCKTCDTFNHGDDTCPTIWRSYLTQEGSDLKLPQLYCYNCGSDMHYGDDCKEPRTSRVPNINGSAFSGANLPRYLRAAYYDRLSDRSKKRSRDYINGNSNIGNDFKRRNNPNPSRSGILGKKKQKPTRSGFIAQKTKSNHPANPSRSGLIERGKKKTRNIKNLY